MRIHGLIIGLLLWGMGLSAQPTAITLTGELTNCQQDSLYFFVLDGVSLRPQGVVPLSQVEGGHAFNVQFPDLPKGFYLLGGGARANTIMLMLGGEETVHLTGTCPTLSQAGVVSPANQAYKSFTQQVNKLGGDFQRVLQQYQFAQRQSTPTEDLVKQMAQIDSQKLALLNQAYEADSLIGQTVALQTYLSYHVHGSAYPSEAHYFANNYYQFVDWQNEELDRNPMVHESAKTYARTLAQVGLPNEQQIAYGDALLNKIPGASSRRKSFILGLVSSFQSLNPDAYVYFAKKYLAEFPQDNPQIAQQLSQEIKALESLIIGAVAPEISLPNPDGDTLHLSDLRGQVVLIDFWASWCRPCRMENPNVVRMYEKFHDQGFEILGVSLDRSKDAWVKAIDDDGLNWLHVSDLKYWSSEAGQTYGVRAIPYTVLLDREGRIVAKKLRGRALENRVEKLLQE